MVTLEGSGGVTGANDFHLLESTRELFIWIKTDLNQSKIKHHAHQNPETVPFQLETTHFLHSQFYNVWKNQL